MTITQSLDSSTQHTPSCQVQTESESTHLMSSDPNTSEALHNYLNTLAMEERGMPGQRDNEIKLRALRDEVSALKRQSYELRMETGRIPVFSGDVETLIEFLDQFDTSATAFGWTNDEKCERFPLYLSKYALDSYQRIPDQSRRIYTELIREFRGFLDDGQNIKTPRA